MLEERRVGEQLRSTRRTAEYVRNGLDLGVGGSPRCTHYTQVISIHDHSPRHTTDIPDAVIPLSLGIQLGMLLTVWRKPGPPETATCTSSAVQYSSSRKMSTLGKVNPDRGSQPFNFNVPDRLGMSVE